MQTLRSVFFVLAAIISSSTLAQDLSDCELHLLEEVRGNEAMSWVAEQNQRTLDRLQSDPRYQEIYDLAYQSYTSEDQIVWGRRRGKWVYNFWQDAAHPLGLYRRTTVESYEAEDGNWETLIDFDQLPKFEGKRLVYKGIQFSPNRKRALVELSPGGGDNVLIWEFDVTKKDWVRGGFRIPEGKSNASWYNNNTILLESNLGKKSATRKSYPRTIRKLKRGEPLEAAVELFKVGKGELSISGVLINSRTNTMIFENHRGFDESYYYLKKGDQPERQIPIPADSKIQRYRTDGFILSLQSTWNYRGQTFPKGALVQVRSEDLLRDGPRAVETIFVPEAHQSVKHVVEVEGDIYIGVLENVRPQTYVKPYGKPLKKFAIPGVENAYVTGYDFYTRELVIYFSDSIHPFTSYRLSLNGKKKKLRRHKFKKPKFDPDLYEVQQLWATSQDGTQVPYFVVAKKGLKLNGQNPVHMYGYGGFGVSLTENYVGQVKAEHWLSKGGVYVVGNARGGGEFGPDWHFSAVKENKQKTFDDFIAIAEHLIEQGYTSPKKIGFEGGSNGGLTSGALMVQRPDLFGANIISVPLLDMLRYHLLRTGPNGGQRVGASWMDEYGDPDSPTMRKVIEAYSPLHNVKDNVDYPEPFFMTSTMDDRVHPGHARKMARAMQLMGYPTLYFENIEGGHGGSVDYSEYARSAALEYVYLLQKLMD